MTNTSPTIDVTQTDIAEDLLPLLGGDAAHWLLPRSPYLPRVFIERRDGVPIAALLVTRRPNTLAAKIAGYWADDAAAGRALISRLLEESSGSGDAAVKWQLPADRPVPDFASELGFVEMRQPYASAEGTTNIRGLVRWLHSRPACEPSYYAQTTEFTCGAVAGLLAMERAGLPGFGSEGANGRLRELTFWRSASNFPACEPIGLAVALRTDCEQMRVEVHLDHDGPVLLESYTDSADKDFRVELQIESARQATQTGIPISRDRVPMGEVSRRISAGALALLLIDEGTMHADEPVPHWVVAHHADDGVIVIQDPWITSAAGETWVDAHQLPVAVEVVDRMTAWGPEGYRGVIFVDRA